MSLVASFDRRRGEQPILFASSKGGMMIYYQIDFNDVLALACHVAYVKYHVVSCPFRNRGFVTVVLTVLFQSIIRSCRVNRLLCCQTV